MAKPTSFKQQLQDLLSSQGAVEFKIQLLKIENYLSTLPDEKRASYGLRLSSALDTARKAGEIVMTPAMKKAFTTLLTNLEGEEDEISNEEAYRRAGKTNQRDTLKPKVDMSTLPAVINKSVATKTGIDVEWHQVKHLPGYLASGIRKLGRQVLAAYTTTPIEEIQVLANIKGSGPNSEEEMKAVGKWLLQNGTRKREDELNFDQVLPGYAAKVVVYNYKSFDFMVVKDFVGTYIYSYANTDLALLEAAGRKRLK